MSGYLLWGGLVALALVYGTWVKGNAELGEVRRKYHAQKRQDREDIKRIRAARRRVLP